MSCMAPDRPHRALDSTPEGFSQEARSLNEERGRNWEDQSPDTRIKARVAETINEILQLQALEDDWDLDGAQPIDLLAIQLAALFVDSVGQAIRQEGLSWQTPSVGPVSDGSVALTWDGGARQTMTIFRPSRLALVVCVTRERGSGPVRQIVTGQEAARRVLWALSGR